MRARVLAPEADAVGQTITLSPDESAHIGRVLRLTAGDQVRVFDGRGREWTATIASRGTSRVTAMLGTPVLPVAESLVRYELAPAVLKGDGTDEVIRDAVMMGAAQVRPFVAARSEVRLATLMKTERQARWARVAVASVKQCGRAVVPPVEPPVTFAEIVAATEPPLRLILVEPGGSVDATRLAALPRPAAVTLAIGPEGGWADEEIRAARAHGWTPVQLGARTVRAVSMALVALAACQAVWDDGL